MIRISDIKVQEVVDLGSGKRIGYVNDVEVDLDSGYVTALVIPGEGGILSMFTRENEIVVPWKSIAKIGTDVILVELAEFEFDDEQW